jgi:hypothetical protein
MVVGLMLAITSPVAVLAQGRGGGGRGGGGHSFSAGRSSGRGFGSPQRSYNGGGCAFRGGARGSYRSDHGRGHYRGVMFGAGRWYGYDGPDGLTRITSTMVAVVINDQWGYWYQIPIATVIDY